MRSHRSAPYAQSTPPSVRTPGTPQRSAAESDVAARRALRRQRRQQQQPQLLSSTAHGDAPPQRQLHPAEPSPILNTTRQAAAARRRLNVSGLSTTQPSTAGSIAYRTPQGYQVVTPEEMASFRGTHPPFEIYRDDQGTQYLKISPIYQSTPPSGQTSRGAQRPSLIANLPSMANTPVNRAQRSAQARNDTTFNTPDSRKGIRLELSEPPPTPISMTSAEYSQTPQSQSRSTTRRSPYARQQPRYQDQNSQLNRSYVSRSGNVSTRRSPAHSTQQPSGYETNLEDVQQPELAPSYSTSGHQSHPVIADAETSAAISDIQEALHILQAKINQRMQAMGADRFGIMRRSSADYDHETGRMRS